MPIISKETRLRDASWVAANLRPEDQDEIYCQLPDHERRAEMLAYTTQQGRSWTVWRDGEPIACYGMTPMTYSTASIWAWGTKDFIRAVPHITDRFINILMRDTANTELTYIEARALSSHTLARRWLHQLGGREECQLRSYGKNGEDFTLITWDRQRWDAGEIQAQLQLLRERMSDSTVRWLASLTKEE